MVWFKNIFEITISNYGFKKNCKIIACDYGISKIFKITVTNDNLSY